TLTMDLAQRGLRGDVEGMLLHSADYLELFSILVIGWQWLVMAAVARESLGKGGAEADYYEGKVAAAEYWAKSEITRLNGLAELCSSAEGSYARMKPDWF